MNIIDITGIEENGIFYGGNTEKYGITYDGVEYMVKLSKSDDDMSVFSEYISSHLISSLGVDCHETFIGIKDGDYVILCKDFISGTGLSLHAFKDTKQSSEDTDITYKEYTYNDVIYLIEKHLKMDDKEKMLSIESFWTMFICDAIIGNRDRHWGNWGYVWDGKCYKFSKLYDNGGGMFPDVNKVISGYIDSVTRKKFMYERVFRFPASLFKLPREDRSYRTNYYEMCNSYKNDVLINKIRHFRELFSYYYVYKFLVSICNELPINQEYKRFYIEIATLRYACIICNLDFDKCYDELEDKLWKL